MRCGGARLEQVALLVDDVHEIAPGVGGGRAVGGGGDGVAGQRASGVGRPPVAGSDLGSARAGGPRGPPGRGRPGVSRPTRWPDSLPSGVCQRPGWRRAGGGPPWPSCLLRAGSDVTGDYLDQEVLARLAPAGRRALAVLAHLGPFDDELARAALGVEHRCRRPGGRPPARDHARRRCAGGCTHCGRRCWRGRLHGPRWRRRAAELPLFSWSGGTPGRPYPCCSRPRRGTT